MRWLVHWDTELHVCLHTKQNMNSRNPTCEQEESSSSHSDAGFGGWVVISHLSALHAHHADNDADKAQQYWHYHEGPTCLDVDWIKKYRRRQGSQRGAQNDRDTIEDMEKREGKNKGKERQESGEEMRKQIASFSPSLGIKQTFLDIKVIIIREWSYTHG